MFQTPLSSLRVICSLNISERLFPLPCHTLSTFPFGPGSLCFSFHPRFHAPRAFRDAALTQLRVIRLHCIPLARQRARNFHDNAAFKRVTQFELSRRRQRYCCPASDARLTAIADWNVPLSFENSYPVRSVESKVVTSLTWTRDSDFTITKRYWQILYEYKWDI